MSLSAGGKFGHWENLAPIGAGGMGQVYCVRFTGLNCELAGSAQKRFRDLNVVFNRPPLLLREEAK
jgi:hypothetical protein